MQFELPEVVGSRITAAAIETGTLTLYQFYDLGYAIDLDSAQALLSASTAQRRTQAPVRQAESIQIAQQPLRVDRGMIAVESEALELTGQLRVSIYDLGTVVLALLLPLPEATNWHTIATLLNEWQQPDTPLQHRLLGALEALETTILPAIERPQRSPIVEDYSLIVVDRLVGNADPTTLADAPEVRAALLGERRPLSDESLSFFTRVSYYADDLALLCWSGALIVDPEPHGAETAADLIEFANVELLQLRSYDAEIEAELPRVTQRVNAVRRRFALPFVQRYRRLLTEVQQLVFDVTEVTERVDNALKVTDDVYWNRLYEATVGVLRVQTWRQGVDHKLSLLREAYEMLHNDADAERASTLEWIIIALILFEVVWALVVK